MCYPDKYLEEDIFNERLIKLGMDPKLLCSYKETDEWLRTVYKISINPIPVDENSLHNLKDCKKWVWNLTDQNHGSETGWYYMTLSTQVDKNKFYDTPYQAFCAGIEYALDNII